MKRTGSIYVASGFACILFWMLAPWTMAAQPEQVLQDAVREYDAALASGQLEREKQALERDRKLREFADAL